MESRDGKHKRGNVRVGFYTKPERKALALTVADVMGISTLTDLYEEGIDRMAKANGVETRDGKISPEFSARFLAHLAIVKTSKVKG